MVQDIWLILSKRAQDRTRSTPQSSHRFHKRGLALAALLVDAEQADIVKEEGYKK